MTELGEPVGISVGHSQESEKCPFCPPAARKGYKTYPGIQNESDDLAAIMQNPDALLSRGKGGPGARPQTGQVENGWTIEQEKPTARTQTDTWYTFQAHHLISGKQAMNGRKIEDWIKASGVNEKDTGYSINCTGNGFWAPSVPKKYFRKWSPLTSDEKQEEAEKVMKAASAQIHISHHSIPDADGLVHHSYDKYLHKKLDDLYDRIMAWANTCMCKPPDPGAKKQATHHVHDALDGLSDHMQGKITGGPQGWEVFLSKYALRYHQKPGNCLHTVNRPE
jgi:hypothetical protein